MKRFGDQTGGVHTGEAAGAMLQRAWLTGADDETRRT